MTEQHNSRQALADAIGAAMWSNDSASQALGMQLLSVKPGYAMVSMQVRADMLNGHQMCHGGIIFTLADSTFAYACNSYNQSTVASACHIDFLAPARTGDVLEAEAIERSLSGRTGVYDITVRSRGGKTVALFRGKSYRIGGEVIAGPQQADADHERNHSTIKGDPHDRQTTQAR